MDINSRDSASLLQRARQSVAAGDSSTMRVLDYHLPLMIERAEGVHVWDVSGKRLIDMNMGYGPLVFGHRPRFLINAIRDEMEQRGTILGFPHERSHQVAELIKKSFPSIDLMRFTSTGSEAGQTAVRLARAYTKRTKIVLFEGHYHGSTDSVFHRYHASPEQLAAREPHEVIAGTQGMNGAPHNAYVIPWNNIEALTDLLQRDPDIAAVIMEPVMGNGGVIPPASGYLQAVRKLTNDYGIVLIFDEVISGFRVARGGAQERYGVQADITMLAKAMGGGVPVGAVGGRAEIMQQLVNGTVFHGGVHSGNPFSMAGALATQQAYEQNGEAIYGLLEENTKRLADGLYKIFAEINVPIHIQHVGSLFSLQIMDNADDPVPQDYRSIASTTTPERFIRFQQAVQRAGVYFHPNRYEPWFISTLHTQEVMEEALAIIQDVAHNLDWQA